MDSWKNLRPSPKNWHEYDEWQKEHYRKYSVYKKRHVRAVMSKSGKERQSGMTITRTETEIPTLIINEQVISDYLYQKMRTQFGLELLNGFLISVNDFLIVALHIMYI